MVGTLWIYEQKDETTGPKCSTSFLTWPVVSTWQCSATSSLPFNLNAAIRMALRASQRAMGPTGTTAICI